MRLNPSTSQLFWVGAVLLIGSIVIWAFSDAHLLAWLLLCGSLPLLLEARAWQEAARIASLRYAGDEKVFEEGAYDFRRAVPRFAVLYCWVFGLLIARETNALPDNGWIVPILLGPMVLWVALTFQAYRRCIVAYVAANGIAKRSGRRWR